jgi:NitT/TauT family transport system substrate-binding protein
MGTKPVDSFMRRGAFLAAGAAAATLGGLRAATGQTLPVVRFIGPPNDGYKSIIYAQRAGLFQKYGVAVEATFINSGTAAAAAITGGAADVAYTNIAAVILGHAKDIPIQILSPAVLYRGTFSTTALLVLKDSPIHSGRDVNGKVVGAVAIDDMNAASIKAWMDQNGGDSRTLKLIEVPASLGVQALEQGRVDAVDISEPAVAQALATGKVRMVSHPLDAISTRFMTGAFAVMKPFADKNADTLKRVALAVHEAQAYTNTHLPETVGIVAEYSKIPADVIAHSIRMVDADYVEVANLQPVIDVMAKYGMLDKAFPARDIISPLAIADPRRKR